MAKTTKIVKAPAFMTEEILNKLRRAFSYGCTDEEACSYAEISHQSLYEYQKAMPDFLSEKRNLKLKPILAARETVVKGLKDLGHARWYMTKKASKEFGDKLNVDHTVTTKVNLNLADPAVRDAIRNLDELARKDLLRPPHETIQEDEEALEIEPA